MVSWWRIDSYFNIEKNKIVDIGIMISAYGLPGSFGSRVMSKSIGYNTCIGRRSHFRSKSTPIHRPVKKSDLNYSYSRSHFSRLPKSVAKNIIYRLSQKVSNAYEIVDPVIN